MSRKGLRPEKSGAAPALYGVDASRYHSQNVDVQADMAAQAICLLCLQPVACAAVPTWSLADLGCGSGLSACAVRRAARHAWLGLDITDRMLRIAGTSQTGCAGHLALADLGQGLPLRPSCLDGAISISAVQASGRHATAASRRRHMGSCGLLMLLASCPSPLASNAVAVHGFRLAAQHTALVLRLAACAEAWSTRGAAGLC
jgi:SAM-dependent methyltransferase